MNFINCLFFLFLIFSSVRGRDVAALKDLCQRFPDSAFCTGGQSAPAPVVPAPVPSANVPQPTGVNPAQYCSQYSANYRYYCAGAGTGDPRAKDFCPSYAQTCPSDTQSRSALSGEIPQQTPAPAPGPIVSNNPVCAQYAQTAAVYCTGPANESPAVKPSCDQFRATCSAPGAIPVQPVVVNQPQAVCYEYERQFLIVCVQQRPVTAEALKFCQQFSAMCLQQQAPQGRRKRRTFI